VDIRVDLADPAPGEVSFGLPKIGGAKEDLANKIAGLDNIVIDDA
jgi:hypothetical protein